MTDSQPTSPTDAAVDLRIVEPDAVQPTPPRTPAERERDFTLRYLRDAARIVPIEHAPPLNLVPAPSEPPQPFNPTPSDYERIADAIEQSRAESTARVYAVQWRAFAEFCAERRAESLPADPATVAAYLTQRHAAGASYSTIAQACAAIAAAHRESRQPDPTKTEGVRRVRAGLARQKNTPKQAAPIRAAQLNRIRADARAEQQERAADRELMAHSARDRRSIERRQRRDARAEQRAAQDIALIAVMRDGLLRIAEAAALRWSDIERDADGDGTVRIERSKTDQTARGATVYASYETMQALDAIRPDDADPSASVFGLSARQLSRRISAAAERAGIDGATGHSPRVGMTRDLARDGASVVELQQVGRWSSPQMPAYYARNEQARTNAVARRIYGKA